MLSVNCKGCNWRLPSQVGFDCAKFDHRTCELHAAICVLAKTKGFVSNDICHCENVKECFVVLENDSYNAFESTRKNCTRLAETTTDYEFEKGN
jgi:hypothetical protein